MRLASVGTAAPARTCPAPSRALGDDGDHRVHAPGEPKHPSSSDPDALTCDCGQPKSRDVDACARCRFLDGAGQGADVIACLREYDGAGATARDLARDLARSRGSIYGSLAALTRRGRVVRIDGRPARYALDA